MIYVSPLPGNSRLVSHAVREIGNRLPEVIKGVRDASRFNQKKRLDEVSTLWQRAGFPTDGSLPASVTPSASSALQTPEIPVPPSLFLKISTLVGEHSGVLMTRRDKAMSLFAGLTPENRRSRASLAPVVREWLDVTDWFEGRAHVPGISSSEVDAKELRQRFEQFERILMALVGEFFPTADEIDAILEDANS